MSLFRPSYRVKGEKFVSKTWWIQFRDHRGVRRKIRAYPDRRTTVSMEDRIEQLVHARSSSTPPSAELRHWCDSLPARVRDALAALDVLDPKQVAAAEPLLDHLAAWQKHLASKGTGERQRQQVHARAEKVIKGCGFKSFTDIDATRVEGYLRDEREHVDEDGKPDGISVRTSNHYLQAVREFMGWAARSRLIAEDPLRVLRPMNAECDRRRERRALTADELRLLLTKAETAADFENVPGTTRALLYRVAAETGLRLAELRALVVSDFDLADTERASVRVRAASAKNRREARLPLRPATATAVKAFLGRALPLATVFGLKRWWKGADAMRADLALAEIPHTDAAERVIDFHSLRVTFATNLARSRVPLQLAQRLMRHSDPRLTSSVYTVLNTDDERGAVAALPELVAEPRVARATGTDGATASDTVVTRPAPRPSERAPRARDNAPNVTSTKPPDLRLDALLVAWSDLDDCGRDAVLQTAKLLARA